MTIAVNPTVLREIRRQRSFSLTSVAEFTSISSDSLAAFEAGKREPTHKQVAKLAKAYGVASYLLASENIPNVEPPPRDFRKTGIQNADISPRGYRAIIQSDQLASFVAEMLSGAGLNFLSLDTQIRRVVGEEKRAKAFREMFSAWLQPKADKLGFAGQEATRLISAIKLFFEAHGRIARTDDAPPADFLGFYLTPDYGVPNIFINRKLSSKKAQLFTLVHEYYHSIIDQEGISDPFVAKNAIERQCNKFAVEFLAPADQYNELVAAAPTIVRADPVALTRYVSQRSLLSYQASAIRLKELEHVSEPTLQSLLSIFQQGRQEEKDEESLGNDVDFGWAHAKRVSELGHLPVFLAKRGIDQRDIDRVDVKQGIGLAFSLQERAFALAEKRLEIATQ